MVAEECCQNKQQRDKNCLKEIQNRNKFYKIPLYELQSPEAGIRRNLVSCISILYFLSRSFYLHIKALCSKQAKPN